MICSKSNTNFKLHGYSKTHSNFMPDVCYYHNPYTIRSEISKPTMILLVDDGYACDMVKPFLRKKLEELG